MTYAELRDWFLRVLNRNDFDSTDADFYIDLGLLRVERLLRTRRQRVIQTSTVDGTFDGYVSIPEDFLGVYEVRVKGTPVRRVLKAQADLMTGYWTEDSKAYFTFTDEIGLGDEIELEYFQQFPRSPDDGDYPNYAIYTPDLAVYSALVFAADEVVDVRKDAWSSTLGSLITEIQTAADNEATEDGLAVTPYGGGIA